MQLEVKINLPANVDDLIRTLAQVAANQERIEQAQAANRELLAGLAQRLDDAASRPTVTVASPPAVQADG